MKFLCVLPVKDVKNMKMTVLRWNKMTWTRKSSLIDDMINGFQYGKLPLQVTRQHQTGLIQIGVTVVMHQFIIQTSNGAITDTTAII